MAEGRRKFDEDFKQGAVRIVRETGKPIAQVARELGINEGTLGNWVSKERRAREGGTGALSESDRAELARLRRENAELAMERGCAQGLGRPGGEGSDGAVSLASLIATQRDTYGHPACGVVSGAGGLAGLVLQVV
jgi:transposase